jgi:hypothetical protein
MASPRGVMQVLLTSSVHREPVQRPCIQLVALYKCPKYVSNNKRQDHHARYRRMMYDNNQKIPAHNIYPLKANVGSTFLLDMLLQYMMINYETLALSNEQNLWNGACIRTTTTITAA